MEAKERIKVEGKVVFEFGLNLLDGKHLLIYINALC